MITERELATQLSYDLNDKNTHLQNLVRKFANLQIKYEDLKEKHRKKFFFYWKQSNTGFRINLMTMI